MRNTAKLLVGGLVGFAVFQLTSHPRSKLHQKLPPKKYKNIHYLPHIKIEHKDKHVHLHHWMNIGSLYLLSLALPKRFKKSHIYHGFMLGSILQGLLYKDRFKIIHSIDSLSSAAIQK